LTYAQTIVDTVREALLVLDGELRVVTASRSFYQIFGVSPEETEGHSLYSLGNGQWDIPALRLLLEGVLPLKKTLDNFEVVHVFAPLGRRVMCLNACTLWREGNHTERVLLAIDDITERKRMEEEMLRSNEDLQRFAYVAAHDLRSPLNTAIILSQLLAKDLQGRLSEEETRLQSMALENMQRLNTLMKDILTYSEMTAAPRQLAVVPLQESLDIALANLQTQIQNNEARISWGVLPHAHADRTQMVLVFQNLIGNALKYRSAETPRIHIEAVPHNSHWQISVADNGQGFEPEYALPIFEPFKRLHGANIPGSGIGLSTCRRIIERLGGSIWAESVPDEGSTFYFTVPVESER